MKYILSLDAGTTSSRALLIDHNGEVAAIEQKTFMQHFPEHGWIEHDPNELWATQKEVIRQLLAKSNIPEHDIAAIGIANQRETTIIWEKSTGRPIWNAIVWNDRRTRPQLEKIQREKGELIYEKTGLYVESYFSASKIDWILSNVKGAKERAKNGELLFGTVNTWILWHLTNGKVFATDVVNASRTLLFNLHTHQWDDELLEIFDIPKCMLPKVRSNAEVYGYTSGEIFSKELPIASMIGDQQAALFGHACFKKGEVKCTYGTGAFLMVNTGSEQIRSKKGLLTTIGWQENKEPCQYALEGLVYSAGSLVAWLKDHLGIIKSAKEVEGLAYSVPDSGDVYFVPALNGLASPYWNERARGCLFGITSSTNIGHIARASLEGIAFQVADVVESIKQDLDTPINRIKCSGGMSEDIFLMQIQADLLRINLARANSKEMTAKGAAFLAGLTVGFWKNHDEIASLWKSDRKFTPQMQESDVQCMKARWNKAVKLTTMWAHE